MYLAAAEDLELTKVYDRTQEHLKVTASLSEGQFQQVSYVNSIFNSERGTYVNYITEYGVEHTHVLEVFNKKHEYLNISGEIVKQQLWVFVNCIIDNPSFDSQVKESMTLNAS